MLPEIPQEHVCIYSCLFPSQSIIFCHAQARHHVVLDTEDSVGYATTISDLFLFIRYFEVVIYWTKPHINHTSEHLIHEEPIPLMGKMHLVPSDVLAPDNKATDRGEFAVVFDL